MTKRLLTALTATGILLSAAVAGAASGRVPVKGVDYHYQVHGQGEPLLLLHGGLGGRHVRPGAASADGRARR